MRIENIKQRFSVLEYVLLLLCFSICLAGAILLPTEMCPDEDARSNIIYWMVDKGTLPTGDEPMSGELYNEEYYHSGCGPIPYEEPGPWMEFFGAVADHIVAELKPEVVLDAGCAMGYLVAALRDRGVKASILLRHRPS